MECGREGVCANSAALTDGEALTDEELTDLSKTFKVLGDEGRLRMVIACMDEPQAVCCLAEIANLSQSLTSHHLRALRDMRILRATRKGRQVFYELDDDHIRHVLQDLIVHMREGQGGNRGCEGGRLSSNI